MKRHDRFEYVRGFVGSKVELTVNRTRDTAEDADREVLVGVLVSAARPHVGTVSDLAIVRRVGYHDAAISLATIEAIEVSS